jgi:hypothetical protein
LLAFDIASCSQALIDFFRAKRLSGEAGNQRGAQFEKNVQSAINATRWSPPAEIATLRGRTLREQGEAITDVDAIGALDAVLVLVSCKSIIYDPAYDAGEFASVQNAARVVSAAVFDWNAKVQRIREKRIGDNFDFSAYREIVGVVCTPFAPYTDDEAALRFQLPGLRAACSASELVNWMQQPAH